MKHNCGFDCRSSNQYISGKQKVHFYFDDKQPHVPVQSEKKPVYMVCVIHLISSSI